MTQVLDATTEAAELPDSVSSSEPRRRPRWRPAIGAGALALLVGLGFVVASLAWNGGKLFAPLDDVYIHLQYGSQLGAGQFFRFNTGDDISAGASSMLYAFVLGAAAAAGLHGTMLLIFAVAFNIVCFAVAAALTCVCGTKLVNRGVGLAASLLVALSGPLAWGAASGMEVGLVMAVLTGFLAAFVIEQPAGRFRYTPVLGALLALVRPEGLIFAAAVTVAVLWSHWTRRRASRPFVTVARMLWSLLPLAVGAAQLLFYRIATGTTSANGVQSKSLLNDRPMFYLGEFTERVMANLHAVVRIFLGFDGQDYAFPGALLLACGGAYYLVLTDRARRPLMFAILAGMAGVLVSLSTLNTALFHELRYFQPFFPLFFLFIVVGCYAATRVVPRPRARRAALRGALVVVLVFSLIAMPTWAVRVARAGATIRETDVSYAAWIKGNLPPGAVVAVKDVGAVAYLSGHPIVDVIGLGTNGFAEASNNGIGTLYEALRQLPESKRPSYFATYDEAPGPSMAQLREVGVLTKPAEFTFDVRMPLDTRNFRIVPFEQFRIERADWSHAGSGDASPGGGVVRDYVNVGDLRGEKAHSYRFLPAQQGVQPWSVVTREQDVIDSGRVIIGGETFTIGNLVPGQAVTLTARTDMRGNDPKMTVVVNGRDVGTWTRTRQNNAAWGVYTFTIPAEFVTSPDLRIEIRQSHPLLSPYPEYTSYGYWATQG